jgi:hydrogenase maturation protease
MTAKILVAGVGNIFLGDDGFGVEVALSLSKRQLPESVTVKDFGIRGFDLAYALLDPWDAVIIVDALPRGEAAGTLYVVEPDLAALGRQHRGHGDQSARHGSSAGIEPGCFPRHDFRAGAGRGLRTA